MCLHVQGYSLVIIYLLCYLLWWAEDNFRDGFSSHHIDSRNRIQVVWLGGAPTADQVVYFLLLKQFLNLIYFGHILLLLLVLPDPLLLLTTQGFQKFFFKKQTIP